MNSRMEGKVNLSLTSQQGVTREASDSGRQYVQDVAINFTFKQELY